MSKLRSSYSPEEYERVLTAIQQGKKSLIIFSKPHWQEFGRYFWWYRDSVGFDPIIVRGVDGEAKFLIASTAVAKKAVHRITATDLLDEGEGIITVKEWLKDRNSRAATDTLWKPMNRWSKVVCLHFKVIDDFRRPLAVATKEQPSIVSQLYATLPTKQPPQQVAEILMELDLPQSVRSELVETTDQPANYLPHIFNDHVHLGRSLAVAEQLVRPMFDRPAPSEENLTAVEQWTTAALQKLGLSDPSPQPLQRHPQTARHSRAIRRGHVDIRKRMNSAQLAAAFPGVSSRRYLKAVRALAHLQRRLTIAIAADESQKCFKLRTTRLGLEISKEDFHASPATAAFVAFYLSQLKAQPKLTADPLLPHMHQSSTALLEHALSESDTRLDVIGMVTTQKAAIEKLNSHQRLQLLNRYREALVWISTVLAKNWKPRWADTNMIQHYPDDAAGWNTAARAWNQLRAEWLRLVLNSGNRELLDVCCPGKVPLLIVDPHHNRDRHDTADIQVFHRLPKPWKIMQGTATCTAATVAAACTEAGLDPEASGWIAPQYSHPKARKES